MRWSWSCHITGCWNGSGLPTEQDLGKPQALLGNPQLQRGKLLGRGTARFCETLSFIAVQAGTDPGKTQQGDVFHSQQSQRGLVLIRSDLALDLSTADNCNLLPRVLLGEEARSCLHLKGPPSLPALMVEQLPRWLSFLPFYHRYYFLIKFPD